MAENAHSDTLEEKILLDRLRRVASNPAGFFAVHIHLSELRPSNRKPHFIRLAVRHFDYVVGNFECTVFQMLNADLVLLCRNTPIEDVEAPVEKVRSLFSEDPLTEVDETGLEEDRLSTWFDLSNLDDMNGFQREMSRLAGEAEIKARDKAKDALKHPKEQGAPITAKHLNAIHQRLLNLKLDDLIRHQLCLHIDAGGPEGVIFRETYISIGDLKKRIAPNINLFSSLWLFQYITEMLDRTMLANMARLNIADMPEPISVNLNIDTVLSRDFQLFHRTAGAQAENIVVEVQVIDIFTDIDSFLVARDILQRNGYRVLIDGITPVSIQFFDPSLLKADFIKIGWGKEFEGEVDDARIEDLENIIRSSGRESIILSRVDSDKAVQWGVKMGVTRFQGYLMDRLVKKVRIEGRRARARRSSMV